MTDRYEQFKEWFKHHPTDEDELDLVFAIGNLFKEFENETMKEKEIKKAICDGMKEVSPKIDSYDNWIEISDWVEAIYQKLKERDLIK